MTAAQDDVFARLAALAERPEADVPIGRTGARASQAVSAAQPLDGCRHTAHALRAAGARRGDKAVVMTRDAYELFTVVHGSVLLGAVPVLIEPRAEVRRCLDGIAPEVFAGEPPAHAARRLPGWGRSHVRTAPVTDRSFPGRDGLLGQRLPVVPDGSGPGPQAPQPHADGLATNASTPGSTGRPKGVEYHHATPAGQLTALATVLRTGPDDEPPVALRRRDGRTALGRTPCEAADPVRRSRAAQPTHRCAVNHDQPVPAGGRARPVLPAVAGPVRDGHAAARGTGRIRAPAAHGGFRARWNAGTSTAPRRHRSPRSPAGRGGPAPGRRGLSARPSPPPGGAGDEAAPPPPRPRPRRSPPLTGVAGTTRAHVSPRAPRTPHPSSAPTNQ